MNDAEPLPPRQLNARAFPQREPGICAFCGKAITDKRRKRYCSEECADEVAIRTNSSYARWKVFERDKGVCAECRIDTVALTADLKRLGATDPATFRLRVTGSWLRARIYLNTASGTVTVERELWDADHVVPVVKGGGGCGLENLRTLCGGCHQKATNELRRELRGGGPTRRELAAEHRRQRYEWAKRQRELWRAATEAER